METWQRFVEGIVNLFERFDVRTLERLLFNQVREIVNMFSKIGITVNFRFVNMFSHLRLMLVFTCSVNIY